MPNNPEWFDEEFYLKSKLNQLNTTDPAGGWTMETMRQAIKNAGFTPFSHFESYSLTERTSPNPFFNAFEYLQAKLQQLQKVDPGTYSNIDQVAKAIQDAGFGLWDHFQRFGWREGVNPSNNFDIDEYFVSKLEELQRTDSDGGWTLGNTKAAFVDVGIDPVSHYLMYGKNEPGVKTAVVPEANRVPADPHPVDPPPEPEPKPTPEPTPEPDPGKIFTLTTDIENLTGTSGNDTFIAGSVGAVSTLNAGDQIDGGAGTDTLKMYDATNVSAFNSAVIKNVEIVENYASSDLDVSANTDVQQAWQFGNVAASTTTTAGLAQTVGLSGAFARNATVTFNNATGANDSATIAVKNVADGDTVWRAVVVANIENLTVQATGDNSLATLKADDTKSLTIIGNGKVSAQIIGSKTLAEINAANNTGGVTLSIDNSVVADAGIAISGGAGKDSILFINSINPLKKATVDLGAGDDAHNYPRQHSL